MFKKYRILKIMGLSVIGLLLLLFGYGYWLRGLLPKYDPKIENTQVADLAYLSENIVPNRGKVLAVVTSTDTMGSTDKSTGYELTELARTYYVFEANGYEVDIASPLGGRPPVVIDDEDMGPFDFAFLNDHNAQQKATNTIPMSEVDPSLYDAVFFAGGKGAMWDFPNNPHIQNLIKELYQDNKVVGAVCHGPAALVNVVLDNGDHLLKDKRVSSFTNDEELLLIKDAKDIFPFLLQDKLTEQGAKFEAGPMYLEQVSSDGKLVTGQNPWSTWTMAENMVKQMGHLPKHRDITDEENAVQVLKTYKAKGKGAAEELIETMTLENNLPVNRILLAKHGILSAMKGEVFDFFKLINLVSHLKDCQEQPLKKA